jgi:hypothetical protein
VVRNYFAVGAVGTVGAVVRNYFAVGAVGTVGAMVTTGKKQC